MCVWLKDGREIRFPAASNRRLRGATPEQLNHIEIICNGTGLHWPDLDRIFPWSGSWRGGWGSRRIASCVSTAFVQLFPRKSRSVGGNRILLHARHDGLQVPPLLLGIGDSAGITSGPRLFGLSSDSS